MKNPPLLVLVAALLSLAGPAALYAEQQEHDHEHNHEHGQEQKALDFSGMEIDEGTAPHSAHSEEKHAHEEEHGQDEKHDAHGDAHGHGHEETATDTELSDTQRHMAEIETMVVKRGSLGEAITSPGEVMLNAYRTTRITPRIPAQVMRRLVQLGDHVKKGQPLVTLSSVEMAEAQGVLMEANVELRRVKKLGRKVVSEKRYVAAQIAWQQAYARVSAYGMTKKQIDSLIRTGDAARATGEFQLLSFQDGTVISDDFVVGELVEPGHLLMEISDESVLWVEARLTPESAARVTLGSPARIQVGERWLDGKVVQARHTLDETTRTLALHLEVANPDDTLHPGQFVNVVIEGKQKQEGIVVPVTAILRSPDGDWQLFVEVAPGRYEPKEVKVLSTVGDQMLIAGIAEGTTIVGKGAFFVQSEMAKGGFDPHNH